MRGRTARICLSALIVCALFSLQALSFDSSLQPEQVQDAYSLGQTTDHEQLTRFLSQYEHVFKNAPANSVAFVQSVEFQTPYEQIVLRSLRTPGYSKFQAQDDYRANPGRILVRVLVALKTGYSGPAPDADDFKVVVSQASSIESQKVSSSVICDPYNVRIPMPGNCIAYTREILLRFSVRQFSSSKATVKVLLPFGQSMETSYNLDKLK
jgi:hypothetical protein